MFEYSLGLVRMSNTLRCSIIPHGKANHVDAIEVGILERVIVTKEAQGLCGPHLVSITNQLRNGITQPDFALFPADLHRAAN